MQSLSDLLPRLPAGSHIQKVSLSFTFRAVTLINHRQVDYEIFE